MIQAGVSGSVSVSFRKYNGDPANLSYRGGSVQQRDAFVGDACTGEEIDQFSIALDGLTRSRVNVQQRTMLHPGYRDDVLVAFPGPVIYCIVANDSTAGQTAQSFAQAFLVDAAKQHMPKSVRSAIVDDLSDDVIGLDAFVAHDSLLDVEIDNRQTLGFDTIIVEDAPKNEFVVGDLELSPGKLPKLVKASEFELGRVDRTLTLGNVEEWTLAAFTEGHPFHKHVNPVQIGSSIDPDTGIDVSKFDSGSVYAGLSGQWKDTVFLPTNLFGAPYVVTIRTHYRRYIGTFVLHCHILDHEDFGMMQVLEVKMPTAPGAGGHGAHGH